MADNITGPLTGSGDATALLAFDEFADGSKAGVVRLDLGSGSTESRVSGTVPVSGTVAVTGPLTDAQLRASAVPVSIAAEVTVNQTINTQVSVSTTAGGTVVAAANATRKGLLLMADTLFYVAVGADPTSASWPVQPGQFWSPPVNMTGQVKCLSSSGTINVNVFEC